MTSYIKMEKVDVSFVIPAYNEEHYLSGCLDAIFRELKKTKCEAEVIVVNNASTDRTAEVAKRYPSVILVNEPRKGLTRARQAGFTASKGELIANVDSDARLTTGWIKTVLREFKENPKLVGLSGPFVFYDLSRFTNFLVKFWYGAGLILSPYLFQGGNFVVRRSALEKIGGFDTSIEFYGEDTDIAKRLMKAGDVKFTFKLPMYSSGRRLAHEGIIKTGFTYARNYFSVSFFKKPADKTYTDIRQKK